MDVWPSICCIVFVLGSASDNISELINGGKQRQSNLYKVNHMWANEKALNTIHAVLLGHRLLQFKIGCCIFILSQGWTNKSFAEGECMSMMQTSRAFHGSEGESACNQYSIKKKKANQNQITTDKQIYRDEA